MTQALPTGILPLWPDHATPEYVAARIELAHAERELRDRTEQVAALRRKLPAGTLVDDYVLSEGPADLAAEAPVVGTRLSELFGVHDTLFVYHLMFHPDDDEACPMCSMWVDGLHGVAHHLSQRTAFAVIAKAPLPKLRAWARRRGWDGLRVLSAFDTTFAADLHTEHASGDQRPAVSVFVRDGDRVRHFYTQAASMIDGGDRGIDPICAVWNVWDLLPAGREEWYPDNDYAGRERG
jgi:predicted dithiol-disulfide oxidoreductase (DUF899 family)